MNSVRYVTQAAQDRGDEGMEGSEQRLHTEAVQLNALQSQGGDQAEGIPKQVLK